MSSSARWVSSLRRGAAPLLVGAAIAVMFLPLSRSYDLDVFLRAGYAALHGLHIYPSPGSTAVYSGSSFVYPYFVAWPFVPLAAMSSGLSAMVFFSLSACAVVAACFLAAEGDPWPVTLTLCSTFTITGLQLGALSPLLFVGVVLLWRLRERPLGLALLAAPVVACKLFLAPLLVWLLLARRYRAFAYASASTLVLLALSFALGPIGPGQYLRMLSQLGIHEAPSGFGLIGALINGGLAPLGAQATALAIAIALLAAAYVHFRRTGDERTCFSAGILASLVLTPVLWSHYLILLSAILLTLGASRRWFVVLVVASWALSQPHGLHPSTDLIANITPSGAWPVVGVSVVAFAYSSIRARGAWAKSHGARR